MLKEMISEKDLYWLAGLLEGDGCFSSQPHRPTIGFCSIDEDTALMVADIFNVNYSTEKHKKYKMKFRVFLCGKKSMNFMLMLKPLMGQRRKNKIKKVESVYNNHLSTTDKTPGRILLSKKEEIIKRFNNGETWEGLAKAYGVSSETLRRVRREKYKDFIHEYQVTNPINAEQKDMYWIAGLLEAEGSFMKGVPSRPNDPIISIQMTDEDVIQKAANILDSSYSSYQPKGQTKSGISYKKVFMVLARGKKAILWMEKLKPLMSSRRQTQIQEALDSYNPKAKKISYCKKQKIPDSELKNIKKLVDKGLSREIIAGKYNVTRNVIRRALQRLEKLKQSNVKKT